MSIFPQDCLTERTYISNVRPADAGEFASIFNSSFQATIENETHGSIFSRPQEVIDFFAQMNQKHVCFTWDIQNMWECGTFPSVQAYDALHDLIRYVHLKGGRGEEPKGPMIWKAPLEAASWPVKEILGAVVRDRASPVICLNSSHGKSPEGYDTMEALRHDLAYVQPALEEIEDEPHA
jgi:sugar phosphate isomerase/epimerase